MNSNVGMLYLVDAKPYSLQNHATNLAASGDVGANTLAVIAVPYGNPGGFWTANHDDISAFSTSISRNLSSRRICDFTSCTKFFAIPIAQSS